MILHVGTDKYEISPNGILNPEAVAVKKKIGLDYKPWMEALSDYQVDALTAFVWIAKKRQDPTVKFEDIVFEMGSIEFEWSKEEQEEMEKANTPKAEEDQTGNV